MPRIPVYQQQVGRQQVQVRPADVRIEPSKADFGGAEAAATQAIGGAVTQIGDIIAQKALRDDKQTSLDLATQFNLEQQDIVADYASRKLKAADGTTIEWQNQTDEQINKMAADQSPRVQQYFRNSVQATYNSNRSKMISHEQTQNKASKDVSYKMFKNESLNNIKENPTNENFTAQTQLVNGAFLELHGDQYSAKELETFTQANTDDMMTGSVTSLLSTNNYSQATDLLTLNKDKISGDVYKALDSKINDGKYIETANNLAASGLSYDDQIAATDKIKNPTERKKVRDEIKYKKGVADAAQKAVYEAHVKDVIELAYDNPNYEVSPVGLELSDFQAIKKMQKQAVDEANGTGGKIDWDRYSKYKKMSSEERKELPVLEIVKINDKAMQKEIIDLQTNDIHGKNQEQAERLRKPLRQADDMVGGMSRFDKKTEDGAKLYSQYIEQFNKQLALIKPEEQTEERVGQLINNLLAPVSVPPSGISKVGFLGEVIKGAIGIYDKGFRFQTFYTPDKGDSIFKKELPENVPRGAKYDDRYNFYYVEDEKGISVYDPTTGILIRESN